MIQPEEATHLLRSPFYPVLNVVAPFIYSLYSCFLILPPLPPCADLSDVSKHMDSIVPRLLKRFSSREGYALYDDVLPTCQSVLKLLTWQYKLKADVNDETLVDLSSPLK